MRRSTLAIVAAVAALSSSGAQAAPVVTNAILGISIQGLAAVTVGGVGTVDVTGSTVTVPAGLVTLGATLVVPVTGTTAVTSLTWLDGLANLGGVFSSGGVSAGEICTGAAPAANGSGGVACNVGGGVGGAMALTGTFELFIVPMLVPLQFDLNFMKTGQGGSTNSPFLIDAAHWSTRTGLLNTGANVAAAYGAGSPFTLVSPTYVNALGNLLPAFATLTLTDVHLPVPEPSALLMVGAGVAGLALLAARRDCPPAGHPARLLGAGPPPEGGENRQSGDDFRPHP